MSSIVNQMCVRSNALAVKTITFTIYDYSDELYDF